jgi:hypothetical protein
MIREQAEVGWAGVIMRGETQLMGRGSSRNLESQILEPGFGIVESDSKPYYFVRLP